MAFKGSLTHFYDHILPKIGHRVWTPEIILEMDMLRQKITMVNEKFILQRSLESNKEQRTTNPELTDCSHLTDEELRQEIARLNSALGNFGGDTTYRSTDVFGKQHEMEMPELNKGSILSLVVQSYWSISSSIDSPTAQSLYQVVARTTPNHQTKRFCYNSQPPYAFWERQWKTGETHTDGKIWMKTKKWDGKDNDYIYEFVDLDKLDSKEKFEEQRVLTQWNTTRDLLTSLLHKHEDNLTTIDNILCFGLGSLDWKRPKHFVQHLAAATIRDTLIKIQAERGINKTIPILAQDPAYCSNCKEILGSQLDIRAVTDFQGFKAVTKNSFIVTVAPSAPVCQVIADLTLGDGGPAAMLCDKFGDDYFAQERNPAGEYTCDEPTKNMVDFKKKCAVESPDDTELVLEMSYDTFRDMYPKGADVLKEWKKVGKNIFTGENIEPADRAWYDECVDKWVLEGKINFMASTLYIRSR